MMMSNPQFYLEKIYVDRKSLDFPLTEKILKRTGATPVEIIEAVPALMEKVRMSRDPLSVGKKTLLLTLQRGDLVKPCPCTPEYIGCNYFIINWDLNCPLDCSYCILQHYLTNPLITIHVNRQDMWAQLDRFLKGYKNRRLRIGTGELGDSLALDFLTESSKELIAYFRTKKNCLFELKTKTVNIHHVLSSKPAENIILSWSLNSEEMAKKEEKGAPPVQARIEAARLVANLGFRVGFHFDPLIYYSGWKNGYASIIGSLLSVIPPSRIAWISLGSLRFSPHLKPIIQRRFPESRIVYEEMIRGKDGKFRYFKPLRIELYREIAGYIRKNGGEQIPIYLCMEGKEIWEKGLKKKPRGKEDVEKSLSLPLGLCR